MGIRVAAGYWFQVIALVPVSYLFGMAAILKVFARDALHVPLSRYPAKFGTKNRPERELRPVQECDTS